MPTFVAAHAADDQLEWPLPDAPELNLKDLCAPGGQAELLNALISSVAEWHEQACRNFIRLGRRPTKLYNPFRQVGLTVT